MAGFAAEFERLAGRPPTEAEGELARRVSSEQGRVSDGEGKPGTQPRALWAESFFPESLALLAVALSSTKGKRVLFVSPSADLLEHRQLRLKNRGPTAALAELAKGTEKSQGVTVWAAPNHVSGSHLTRAFGSGGPDLIIIEDAHAILGESFAFRPSMAALKDVLARYKDSRVVVAAAARGEQFRSKVGKALGLKSLTGKEGASHSVVESVIGGSAGPLLRVESEESEAIAAIIGPLPRPGLVLCSTPAQADQVYAHLEAEQVPVHRYHSGLPASERARELLHFALPGRRAVMVAVSSYGPGSGFAGDNSEALPEEFGHGYARRDIRSLVHLCAPCSLDQYTRELALLSSGVRTASTEAAPLAREERLDLEEEDTRGNGQLDSRNAGHASVAVMLYNPAHLALNLALLERKRPAIDTLHVAIHGLLGAQKGQYRNINELAPGGTTSPRSLALVLEFLKDLGVVEVQGSDVRATVGVPELKAAQKSLEDAFEKLGAGDAPRLEEVEQYALSTSCRVETLHKLLGQRPSFGKDAKAADAGCGRCDVCAPEGLAALIEARRGHGTPSPAIETLPLKRRNPARRGEEGAREGEDLYEDDGFAELDQDLDSFSA